MAKQPGAMLAQFQIHPKSSWFGDISGWWLSPLKNMSSSAGMMTFPTEWKNKINVPHHQPDDISQSKIQVSSTVPLNHNLPWWGQSDVIVAATAFQPRPVLQTLRAFPWTPWQWRNPDSTKVPKVLFILGMDWIIDNYHIYLRLNGWMICYNLHLPMISNWII